MGSQELLVPRFLRPSGSCDLMSLYSLQEELALDDCQDAGAGVQHNVALG